MAPERSWVACARLEHRAAPGSRRVRQQQVQGREALRSPNLSKERTRSTLSSAPASRPEPKPAKDLLTHSCAPDVRADRDSDRDGTGTAQLSPTEHCRVRESSSTLINLINSTHLSKQKMLLEWYLVNKEGQVWSAAVHWGGKRRIYCCLSHLSLRTSISWFVRMITEQLLESISTFQSRQIGFSCPAPIYRGQMRWSLENLTNPQSSIVRIQLEAKILPFICLLPCQGKTAVFLGTL